MVDSRRILLVDDEDDIRFVLQIALETSGSYQVLPCASGAEALELAVLFRPQLFILDFMMPEMNGAETWEKLAALEGLGETPAIFITAKAERSAVDTLVDLGAFSVITKPFVISEVVSVIDELWTQTYER
jgi:CheY-like chemotaxis protein